MNPKNKTSPKSKVQSPKSKIVSRTYQVEFAETAEVKWQQCAPIVMDREDALTLCAARNIEAHYKQTGQRHRAVRITKEVVA